MIGQNVGNYRIVRLLGEGGMGKVYLAEHPGLGRQAAVKILRAELARDDQMIRRLFNEARAANAIGDPHIVEVWDFGSLPSGEPYLMMELLRGESLGARMRRAGRLPLASALDIADQAAGALGAAHGKGVVHRDLKPDNLFLVPDPGRPGRDLVKILDFGIAKLAQPPEAAGKAVTRTGVVLGTPLYMSPEQCRSLKDVDHRSDIYSLGIIVYEMLSGAPPFSSDSSGELVHMHIGVEAPALRAHNPDLPRSLEQVVSQTLQKDPAARFQSMADLRRALAEGAPRTVPLERPAPAAVTISPAPAGASTPTEAAGEVHEPTVRRRRRPRWALPAVVAGSVAVTVALVMLATEKQQLEPPSGEAPAEPPIAGGPPAPDSVGPRMIAVNIATLPAGARVVRARDGAVLGLTPVKLSWPGGTGAESLRLERDGYRNEIVVVPLDRGIDVRLALAPVPAAAVPAAAQEAPPEAPKHRPARGRAKPGARPAPSPVTPAAPARKPQEPLKI
jgi:serine/threonine-protein kinase